MKNLMIISFVLLGLVTGVAVAQTAGMPMNPANSQPGTSMPMNNGTTVPVPLGGGINNNGMTQVPPIQAQPGMNGTLPPASTPMPGPTAY